MATHPHNIIEKKFPKQFFTETPMTLDRKQILESEIEELEEGLEGLEFSTYLYDVLTSQVEAKYVELSRLKGV